MKKLKSLFLIFSLAFTLAPTSVLAEGDDLGTTTLACDANVAACIGEVGYTTLQEAIDVNQTAEINLMKEITESVIIESDKNITLNLNGNKITNSDGQHTITNRGTLIINGEGTVDNVSHGKGALLNDGGNATIKGGEFTRSKENGQSSTDNGGNSWYVISNENNGTMSFEGGNVHATGKYSSLVRNYGTMDIKGGIFSNSFIAIKSEEGTTLNITNGEIYSDTQSLQTYGTATISGGSLKGQVTVVNWQDFKSTTTITGGSITGDVVVWDDSSATQKIDAIINGGTVDGSLVVWDNDGKPIEENDRLNIDVQSGTFSENVEKFVVDDAAFLNVDGTYFAGSEENLKEKAKSATTSVNVIKGVKELDDISPDVTVTNSTNDKITVNKETLESGKVVVVKPSISTTPNVKDEASKTSGYDDGGPFTTDACGNVFDRWGNEVYHAPVCVSNNSAGDNTYTLVNTSDH